MTKETHVKITGRVQGVFFRMCAQQKARELGVSGWVKNCRDGSVEALFQGDHDTLSQMISWCWTGSPDSRVEHVQSTEYPCASVLDGFDIQ